METAPNTPNTNAIPIADVSNSSGGTMTNLALAGLFCFSLKQILDFFGVDQSVYMIYLSFGSFMFINTLVLDTKYPQIVVSHNL